MLRCCGRITNSGGSLISVIVVTNCLQDLGEEGLVWQAKTFPELRIWSRVHGGVRPRVAAAMRCYIWQNGFFVKSSRPGHLSRKKRGERSQDRGSICTRHFSYFFCCCCCCFRPGRSKRRLCGRCARVCAFFLLSEHPRPLENYLRKWTFTKREAILVLGGGVCVWGGTVWAPFGLKYAKHRKQLGETFTSGRAIPFILHFCLCSSEGFPFLMPCA